MLFKAAFHMSVLFLIHGIFCYSKKEDIKKEMDVRHGRKSTDWKIRIIC